MYCGICVEVCPFDALFWSPEFEYAEYDVLELLHEKDRLRDWTYKVMPPPELEVGAEPEPSEEEEDEDVAPTSVTPIAEPGTAAPEQPAPEQPAPEQAAPEQAAPEQPAPEQPAPEQPAPEQAVPERAAPEQPAPQAERVEVEPDQATYERVLQEQLDAGVNPRVAEGRAKAAAIRAARQQGGGG